jgi:hypothetical protein
MALLPRLEDDEIKYFKSLMENKPDGTEMVEFGSGGSTCMFVKYFQTGRLVSIEHNEQWYNKVREEIVIGDEYSRECCENFSYIFKPPTFEDQPIDIRFYGYGVPYEENPCFASTYIDPTGDVFCPNIWNSDIYFVNGICRGAVLSTIHAKAKKRDAAVFIHDYYGPEKRVPWYNWASNLYSDVKQVGSTLARLYL